MTANYVPSTDAGSTYAADDVAGVKYPVVKLDVGGAGSASLFSGTLPVSLASVPSHAVTNAGTFATQATLAAETTKVIGTVNVAASQTIAVTDNSGTLTVDAPVATPVFVRLSDGSAAITTLPVSLAANQSTNVAQLAGTTTDTNSGVKSAGTLRVVIATDQPQLTNKLLVTPDANSAVNLGQVSGTTAAVGNGTASAGCQRVTIASDNTAFSVNAVQSGTWTMQPGNTANTTAWLVNDAPATSGGLSQASLVSAATNNKTAIKASAGQLYFISAQNLNAAPRYVKVFDKTSANVTAGTTACDYQFLIPGNTAGAGLVLNIDKGIAHANAITILVTTGIATTDNTSTSANEVVLTLGYK